jgi:hypothetical protein
MILIHPYVVLEVDFIVVVPFVVVLFVLQLDPPHGPPFEHENHRDHPLHLIAFVCVAFVMLLSLAMICSFLV